MHKLKLFTVFLIASLLLIGSVSAKTELNNEDEKCDIKNDENVREEIVGLSPDGKDILMKRITSHPARASQAPKSLSGNRCYKLMGIKWTTQNVPYVINPAGSNAGMEEVVAAFTTSINTWDTGTSRALFGERTIGATKDGYDGKNTMFFNNSLGIGTIAQTTTYYYRFGREIVEFDIEYNTAYQWGDAAVDSLKMDLEGIATHELGHGIGLADLYTTECTEVTMFGYSGEGEFKKRTLESGDLSGLWKMYGQ